MGAYDYKINPDFIVGYIDVESKQIVLNPKYSRQHDYTGLEEDTQIFRRRVEMSDERTPELFQVDSPVIEQPQVGSQEESEIQDEKVDVEMTPSIINGIIGTLNSINFRDGEISEDSYRTILEELLESTKAVEKVIPLLTTDEELRREEEKRRRILEEMSSQDYSAPPLPGFDMDFELDGEETYSK